MKIVMALEVALALPLLGGSALAMPNRRKVSTKPRGSASESLTKPRKTTTAHFNELVSDKEVIEALEKEAASVLAADPEVAQKNRITASQLVEGSLLYMRLRHQRAQLIEQSLYFGRDFMAKVMSGHKANDRKEAQGEPIERW